MNPRSGKGEKEGPFKNLYRNERWVRDCEGMESNEISLGSLEDGLYFRKEEKGMYLL